jgi:hypothetical protein
MHDDNETGPEKIDESKKRDARKRRLHWGARQIGERIEREERETYHLLETKKVSGAIKVGRLWCLPESKAREQFGD